MSDKYKIFDGDEVYFVTSTIVDWIKVLAEDNYKYLSWCAFAKYPSMTRMPRNTIKNIALFIEHQNENSHNRNT